MSLLRNLGRRKLRTTLTVLGIVIGIWALVVFSSMANKINKLVAAGSDYYIGKVVVSDGSTSGLGIGLVPIDVSLAGQIRKLDGAGAVDPQVEMPFEDVKAAGFGIPKLILGAVAGADNGLDKFSVKPAQGRLLTAADEGSRVTVLGSNIARTFDVGIGATIDVTSSTSDARWLREQALRTEWAGEGVLAKLRGLAQSSTRDRVRQALEARAKDEAGELQADDAAALDRWLDERPPIPPDQLRALAEARLAKLSDALHGAGGIDPSRIVRGEPPSEVTEGPPTATVQLGAGAH